jgi:hypothetical protein
MALGAGSRTKRRTSCDPHTAVPAPQSTVKRR